MLDGRGIAYAIRDNRIAEAAGIVDEVRPIRRILLDLIGEGCKLCAAGMPVNQKIGKGKKFVEAQASKTQ